MECLSKILYHLAFTWLPQSGLLRHNPRRRVHVVAERSADTARIIKKLNEPGMFQFHLVSPTALRQDTETISIFLHDENSTAPLEEWLGDGCQSDIMLCISNSERSEYYSEQRMADGRWSLAVPRQPAYGPRQGNGEDYNYFQALFPVLCGVLMQKRKKREKRVQLAASEH